MGWLTPAERRAVVLVAMLFALGAGRDLWLAHHPRELPRPLPLAGEKTHAGSRDPRMMEPAPMDSGIPQPPGALGSRPAAGDRAPIPVVDLNRASMEELDRLPGVGPVLARRILEHRQSHGRFREVDELLAVRGIGPRLLERMREHVQVNAP